jgi:hypothetical protein
MMLEIFSPKKMAKNLAFFVQNTASFCKICIINRFSRKTPIFSPKIGENWDHNIDSGCQCYIWSLFSSIFAQKFGVIKKRQCYDNFFLPQFQFHSESPNFSAKIFLNHNMYAFAGQYFYILQCFDNAAYFYSLILLNFKNNSSKKIIRQF